MQICMFKQIGSSHIQTKPLQTNPSNNPTNKFVACAGVAVAVIVAVVAVDTLAGAILHADAAATNCSCC
eukprot:7235806-Karenia_brevis.AAC.1